MTIGVVSAQRQAGELLADAGLQAGVVAARIGTEFVDGPEAPIERLIVGEWREASRANSLVSVQLHLIWLMHAVGATVIDAQRAAGTNFALDAKAPLQEVGRLQRAAGKGIQVHCQRTGWRARRYPDAGRAAGSKPSLKVLIRLCGRIDCAVG